MLVSSASAGKNVRPDLSGFLKIIMCMCWRYPGGPMFTCMGLGPFIRQTDNGQDGSQWAYAHCMGFAPFISQTDNGQDGSYWAYAHMHGLPPVYPSKYMGWSDPTGLFVNR